MEGLLQVAMLCARPFTWLATLVYIFSLHAIYGNGNGALVGEFSSPTPIHKMLGISFNQVSFENHVRLFYFS